LTIITFFIAYAPIEIAIDPLFISIVIYEGKSVPSELYPKYDIPKVSAESHTLIAVY
jgi:hypothetical protein